jgi:UDP-glucose 4-epimerase
VNVLSRQAEPGLRAGVEYHRGCQSDVAIVAPLLARCTAVVHLAAATTPGCSAQAPQLEVNENLVPLARFIETLAEAGPRRLVFLSSGGAIYGNPAVLPATEALLPSPLSYHAAGKVAAEEFFRAWAQRAGAALAILRPSNVYGPGQPLQSGFGFVRTVLERARTSQAVDIWGDGRQVRDFLYIDDLVDACLMLLAAPEVAGTFNAGAGVGTALLDLLRMVEQVTGRPIPITLHPGRGIDVNAIWLDSSRLHAATGWRANTPLAAGIARTWDALAH